MAASKKENMNAGRVEYLGDDREGKLAALNNAVAAIEKNYGKGSIMKLGDSSANIDIEAIPTGSISLDVALGVGGVPRGRIIEIYGPESSGKTTVALHMIAEAQKRNGIAGFIDAEHALDPQYAKKIGVDIDNLYISQPDNGEQALEIAETMIRSGALDIVIVDSVAALVPKAEIEGDMDDQQVGLHARLMSKAMRKLTGVINRSNCAVVFINQLREKVGIMFGNPEVTTGGRALKFYASVRMDVRRVEAIKQGGEIIGNHTKVKVVKNKVAPPFKEAEFDIMFGQGISREGDLIDLAVKVDAVQKSGAWYAYKGEKIGQGRENAKTFLREHPEIMAEVEVQVREYYGLPADTVVETAVQAADTEVQEILSEARKKAKKRESDIVEEANEEAARVRNRASQEIELEKAKAQDEIRQEIIQVATAMASKIVTVSLTEEQQNALLEETLKEIGDDTWLSR